MRLLHHISKKIGVQILLSFAFFVLLSLIGFVLVINVFNYVETSYHQMNVRLFPLVSKVEDVTDNLLSYTVFLETLSEAETLNAFQKTEIAFDKTEAEVLAQLISLNIEDLPDKYHTILDAFDQMTERSEQIKQLLFNGRITLNLSFLKKRSQMLTALKDQMVVLERVRVALNTKNVDEIVYIISRLQRMESALYAFDIQTSPDVYNNLKQRYSAALDDISYKLNAIEDQGVRSDFADFIAVLYEQISAPAGLFVLYEKMLKNSFMINQAFVEYKGLQYALNSNVLSLLQFVRAQFNEELARMEHQVERNIFVFYSIIAGYILFMLMFVRCFLYPRVIRRIESLSSHMSQVALGDYAREINIRGDDEISSMSKALDAFQESLKHKEAVERDVIRTKQFQDLIMSNIPDLLFIKDDQFRIVQCNTLFLELYPEEMRDKVIGYTTLESYLPDEMEEFLEMDKLAFKEGYSETEETVLCPDGRTRTLFTKKVRFYDIDNNAFILGVARDITDMKATENELKRSNEELDDFAYIASHDLKEPLRGIHNYASFLIEDYEDDLDEDGKYKLNRLQILSQRMEKLINDLLYFSRLGRGDEAVKLVDLNEEVDAVRDLISGYDDVEIKVHGTLPSIECDSVRISEIFRNLITNGIKYNNSDHKIVEIGVDQGKSIIGLDYYVFYVRDNGIGIAPRFHKDVFRIFKRLHKKDAYGGGTGSGLTFVKKILDRFGGDIWIESDEGQGTTFFFTLKPKP